MYPVLLVGDPDWCIYGLVGGEFWYYWGQVRLLWNNHPMLVHIAQHLLMPPSGSKDTWLRMVVLRRLQKIGMLDSLSKKLLYVGFLPLVYSSIAFLYSFAL